MLELIRNKTMWAGILVFILMLSAYSLFSTDKTGEATPHSPVGADLLEMAEDISRATLDEGLFSDPGYLYLSDFSRPIPPQQIGRKNPFDPIGRD